MQLHMHSLKSLVGKVVLSVVALSALLVFAGVPAAQAQDWRNRPVARYEHRVYYGHPDYVRHEAFRHGWRDRFGCWHAY